MLHGAWAGADGTEAILADSRLHTAAFDAQAPFAHTHQPHARGQSLNDFDCPIIRPAPIPRQQPLFSLRGANAFEEGHVPLRDDFRGAACLAASAFTAASVRPAVRQV